MKSCHGNQLCACRVEGGQGKLSRRGSSQVDVNSNRGPVRRHEDGGAVRRKRKALILYMNALVKARLFQPPARCSYKGTRLVSSPRMSLTSCLGSMFRIPCIWLKSYFVYLLSLLRSQLIALRCGTTRIQPEVAQQVSRIRRAKT